MRQAVIFSVPRVLQFGTSRPLCSSRTGLVTSMTTHLSRIHSVTVGPGKCPLVDILLSGVAQYLHYRSITPPHFPPREAIEKVGDGDTFRDKSIGSRSFRAKVMNLAIRAGPLAVTCVGLLLKGWKTSPSFSRKLFWFSNTFILLGAGLRLYCFKVLGKYFTFALAVQDDQKVIKKGPYSLVRHPSYTGFLVESIGTLATGYITNPLIPPQLTFLGVILALWQGFSEWRMVMIRVKDEEKLLKKEFGKEYEEYIQEVPYKFLRYIC